MTHNFLNSIGLGLDIIGVLLIWWFGSGTSLFVKNSQGVKFDVSPQKRRDSGLLDALGLGCLVLGFSLQLAANYINDGAEQLTADPVFLGAKTSDHYFWKDSEGRCLFGYADRITATAATGHVLKEILCQDVACPKCELVKIYAIALDHQVTFEGGESAEDIIITEGSLLRMPPNN